MKINQFKNLLIIFLLGTLNRLLGQTNILSEFLKKLEVHNFNSPRNKYIKIKFSI